VWYHFCSEGERKYIHEQEKMGKQRMKGALSMFWTYIKYNFCVMTKGKLFWIAFLGMLCLAVGMPLYHVWQYRGYYTYQLPSADTLYLGNYNGIVWSYLCMLFPFLIVLPYGFSYISEVRSGARNYVQTRGTRRVYYYAQFCVCFLSVFLVFFVPLIINIVLNGVFFPVNGNDYITLTHLGTSNWGSYITGSSFTKPVLHHGMILKHLVMDYPQLYNVIFAGIAGVGAGIMGMFIYAVSLVIRKHYIYLLIASFLLFQFFIVLNRYSYHGKFSSVYVDLNPTDYLANRMIANGKDYIIFGLLMLAELIVSGIIIQIRTKRDEL
jgi:hypothetical protein